MVLLGLQLLQLMIMVCDICQYLYYAPITSVFQIITCTSLFCFQGMMCFWETSVVWFLENTSIRTSPHESKSSKTKPIVLLKCHSTYC